MGKFTRAVYDKKYYRKNCVALRKRQNEYREENREAINARLRDWYRKKGRDVKRAWRWMVEYGLTATEVGSLFLFQGNRCAICGEKTSLEGRWKSLNIDHEHGGLNRVRGLLCTLCNRILGSLERRPKVLKLCKPFWDYISNPPARKLKIGGWKS